MGERGPIPSPKGKADTTLPAPSGPRPPAPDGLSEPVAQAWDAYWASPVSSALSAVDMPAVRRLFNLYEQHAKSADVVSQALVVRGSVGQVRVNPLADHMLKLESAILRLENELGLTPSSRVRLGIALADVPKEASSVIDELARRRAAAG